MVESGGANGGYDYFTTEDTTEHYDVTGKLLSITDIRGNTKTLSYDTSGRLATVTTGIGASFTFAYGPNDRISTLTDQAGRVWIYEYDANNNLASIVYPDETPADVTDNPKRAYLYENGEFPHALTSIIDCAHAASCDTSPANHYANFEYDAAGRAIASYHGPQTAILTDRIEGVTIAYHGYGNRAVTNSRNKVSSYTTTTQLGMAKITDIAGPGCTSCGAGNSSSTYDADNNLARITVNNHVTLFGNYDANGNPGCKVEGVSAEDTSTGVCTFDPVASPNARRIDYTYDQRFHGKVSTITEPSVYAAGSKLTINTYDAYANLTGVSIMGFKPDGTAVSRNMTYTYAGPLHQLTQIDGPRTDVQDITTLDYYADVSTQGSNRARLMRVTGPTGIALRDAIQYSATGKILSESRPNGVTHTYRYYAGSDRLQTLTQSDGSVTKITSWTYLTTGEVRTITQADGSADPTTLIFDYDAARRLTRITDGLGDYIEFTLDTEGNRIDEKTFDAGGDLKELIRQTFDDYNLLSRRTSGDVAVPGMVTENSYSYFSPDGTLDQISDGLGSVTQYTYDDLKRLTTTTQDSDGFDPTTANATTGFGYDNADRLTAVTDPVNGATTYTYDDLGNLLTHTSPDTGITTFTYDSAGNLKTKTDAKGQQFSYSYDALNRVILLDAPGMIDDISYSYDSCANGIGRLCHVTSNSAIVRYSYDSFGNLKTLPGVAYSYDNANRVKTLTYPSGAKVTYSYNPANQVSSVTLTINGVTHPLASNLTYTPFGPITALTYGNGLTLTQSYDTAYRITSQSIPGVLAFDYSQYDANGNLNTRGDVLLGQDEYYNYDALNRLDTADGEFGTRDYNYDKNGNRTSLNSTSYAYTPNSNRLATIGNANVLLDANGNTLNKATWTFDYSAHNRLVAAYDDGTLAATYAYNGLGQRIRKTRPDGTGRHFLYGTNGELLAETDGDGNILHEYVFLNEQLLAVYQPDDDQDGLSNAEEDILGTNPANVDSDGDGLRDLDEWYLTGTDAQLADTDGDGVLDGAEYAAGTDPLSPTTYPGDGDVNADGEVNAGDLVLVMQMAFGQRVPTAAQLVRADINRDGVVDVVDVLLLQRRILGYTTWNLMRDLPGMNSLLAGVERTGELLASAREQIYTAFIGTAHADVANGKLYYVHTDHLGTPKVMTNEAGAVVWSAVHDPFGMATVAPGATVEMNVRYPGQYYDAETGLHYNYFRTYDPGTGRYLESDPIGLVGGLNTYLYGDANPTRFVDPYGLATYLFGGSASFQAGGAGASASVGFGQERGTENNGRICMVIETCGRVGPGASAGAAFFGEVGEGSFCPGNEASAGGFMEGGAGFFEGFDLKTGMGGNSASASFKSGVGGGGAVGTQACLSRTICFP